MNEETIEEKCAVSDEVTAATSAIYQAEMRKLDAVADFEYDCSVHGGKFRGFGPLATAKS